MAENSKIEWTDHTFNPWIGCTKVGPGCDHCYAERDMDKRLHVAAWGPGMPRVRTKPANWAQPAKWNREHEAFYAKHGRRQRVFCASLADVFDNEIDHEWRADLFEVIQATPNLDWLLLTKRIGNVERLTPFFMPENVWLGASIVNQEEADRDIRKLIAAKVNMSISKVFLSMEPLLGPVSLRWLAAFPDNARGTAMNPTGQTNQFDGLRRLDWVIVGGESGPEARPMHPTWAATLRDECEQAGVPFLFKQWGEWAEQPDAPRSTWVALDGRGTIEHGTEAEYQAFQGNTNTKWRLMMRPGKKAAGRLLDGRTHDGFPAPRAQEAA